MTQCKRKAIKTIHLEIAQDENVTSFGGMMLNERLAMKLGLWNLLEKALGQRQGQYSWLEIIKPAIAGLLTGSQGTYATQHVREESPLLDIIGMEAAPEEATFWRSLKQLGESEWIEAMAKVQFQWTVRILSRATRNDLLHEGFFPVFADGELSEGSPRREATKTIRDKGAGLLWATVFAGPLAAAQRLCAEGEGEQTAVRGMLDPVVREVLKPLGLHHRALLLADSLHGDEPTLKEAERLNLHYVAGANKLRKTADVLSEQPGEQWEDTGAMPGRGWAESAVCVCWIQCPDWPRKRTLVGRRFRREGEMHYEYSGILTNLTHGDVRGMMDRGLSFGRAAWRLYDYKAGMENYYKDLLTDLGLHHPPCQRYKLNAAFFSIATLAHTLGAALDILGGGGEPRGQTLCQDGQERKRPTPRRMRLATLRRLILTVPARVACHARVCTVTILGISDSIRALIERFWTCVNLC